MVALALFAALRVLWLLLAGEPGSIELEVWLVLLTLPVSVWFIRWSKRRDEKILARLGGESLGQALAAGLVPVVFGKGVRFVGVCDGPAYSGGVGPMISACRARSRARTCGAVYARRWRSERAITAPVATTPTRPANPTSFHHDQRFIRMRLRVVACLASR